MNRLDKTESAIFVSLMRPLLPEDLHSELILYTSLYILIYFFRFFSYTYHCYYLFMYVHEVLVNRLGCLSLPRKSVVRLTDRPDMAIGVYSGRKATTQQLNLFM